MSATETRTTPPVTVREVFGDEIGTHARTIANYAFGASPLPPESAASTERERQAASEKYGANTRHFVSFSGDQAQATAVLLNMTENVRGKIMSMAAIGAVASMPAGRRQGHVRQIFVRMFEEMRESGQVVSTLYPFRESFYERLGYVTAPRTRFVTLDPAHLSPLVRMDLPGTVEQASMTDGWETWRTFIERVQQQTHGFALRDRSADIRNRDENTRWLAFAYDDNGVVAGAMTFKITGYGKSLDVDRFYTTTTDAIYQLLSWIGRHVDQVKQARIEIAADEYPDLWFHDLRPHTSTMLDEPWPGATLRVISVDGLTGTDAGPGDFEIAIRISDDYAPWNNGIFTFTGHDGSLTVTPGGEPELDLSIQGLSALVFCGHDPATFRVRGWGTPDAAAQTTLRSLFPKAFPILHEGF
ncbi:MAG: GNAT family N-acetyltransferase [Thermomicrobiales bacterium]